MFTFLRLRFWLIGAFLLIVPEPNRCNAQLPINILGSTSSSGGDGGGGGGGGVGMASGATSRSGGGNTMSKKKGSDIDIYKFVLEKQAELMKTNQAIEMAEANFPFSEFASSKSMNDDKNPDMGKFRSEERRLRDVLMESYVSFVRPVFRSRTVTYVYISLSNIQVMSLDEQNQIMVLSSQILLKWSDEFLKWDPKDFNNQTKMVFLARDIWTPDIVLFNSAELAFSSQRDNFLLDVYYNGSVRWMFTDILRSYCPIDIRYFPFDRQNCMLELQSWSRSKSEIMLINDDKYANQSQIKTEWDVLRMSVTLKEQNNIVYLEYTLSLKRNSAFYVNNLIVPFAILSSFTLFVFWLPPDSGDKITLTITVLLALSVFLQLITKYMPKSSKSLPILAVYLNVNQFFVLISIVLTIAVLNFHFRGPKKDRVPPLLRKYVLGYLAVMLGFKKESKAFEIVQVNNSNRELRRDYEHILGRDRFFTTRRTSAFRAQQAVARAEAVAAAAAAAAAANATNEPMHTFPMHQAASASATAGAVVKQTHQLPLVYSNGAPSFTSSFKLPSFGNVPSSRSSESSSSSSSNDDDNANGDESDGIMKRKRQSSPASASATDKRSMFRSSVMRKLSDSIVHKRDSILRSHTCSNKVNTELAARSTASASASINLHQHHHHHHHHPNPILASHQQQQQQPQSSDILSKIYAINNELISSYNVISLMENGNCENTHSRQRRQSLARNASTDTKRTATNVSGISNRSRVVGGGGGGGSECENGDGQRSDSEDEYEAKNSFDEKDREKDEKNDEDEEDEDDEEEEEDDEEEEQGGKGDAAINNLAEICAGMSNAKNAHANIIATPNGQYVRSDALKYMILKEIIECQQKLLNCQSSAQMTPSAAAAAASASTHPGATTTDIDKLLLMGGHARDRSQHSAIKKPEKAKISPQQISDEWKVFAMIMDRAFFFLYFSFQLMSTMIIASLFMFA